MGIAYFWALGLIYFWALLNNTTKYESYILVWLLFQFFFFEKKKTLITEIERIYFSALKFENIKIYFKIELEIFFLYS